MRVFHSVVIHEKHPSKRCRIKSIYRGGKVDGRIGNPQTKVG